MSSRLRVAVAVVHLALVVGMFVVGSAFVLFNWQPELPKTEEIAAKPALPVLETVGVPNAATCRCFR